MTEITLLDLEPNKPYKINDIIEEGITSRIILKFQLRNENDCQGYELTLSGRDLGLGGFEMSALFHDIHYLIHKRKKTMVFSRDNFEFKSGDYKCTSLVTIKEENLKDE